MEEKETTEITFGRSVFIKIIETIISVKIQVIFTLLIVSTIMLWNDKLSGDVWGTVNAAVISTVFALREGFKVSKVNSSDDSTNIKV